MTKLAHWFKKVEEPDFKSISTLRKTIMIHYRDILNYFHQRSSNAAAESFNAKNQKLQNAAPRIKRQNFLSIQINKNLRLIPELPFRIMNKKSLESFDSRLFCCGE